jgi:hypothetical protein
MSFNEDGQEVLIPTVATDGSRVLSDQEAIEQYRKTGQSLGKFDTAEHATAYARQLHEAQARNMPGQPTPQDYIASLNAAPTWINAPRNDAWWLVDQGGRFVMDRAGNHIAVPFSVATLPPASSPASSPAYQGPF